MPITLGTYKCLHCEQEFDATSEEYRECGCGETSIKLYDKGRGWMYEINGGKADRVDESTYYSKDEFLPMTEKMKSLIEEIKEIHSRVSHFYRVLFYYESDIDGNTYLSRLSVSYDRPVNDYSSEMNFLESLINFTTEYSNSVEIVENRLDNLVKLMGLLSSGELNFSDRDKIFELTESLDIDYGREKIKGYNYTFYV